MRAISDSAGPALIGFFEEFSKTLSTILPLAGQGIGIFLRGVSNALAQPEIQNGLVAKVAGLNRALLDLEPALMPAGRALGALMELMGTMAEATAPYLAAVIETLANAISTLAPSIEPIITLLGAGLLGYFEILAPIIDSLAKGLADLFANPALMQSLQDFGEAVGPSLERLGLALADLVATILEVLAENLPVIIDALAEALPTLIDALVTMAETTADLIEFLGELIDLIGPALGPVLTGVADAVTSFVVPAFDLLSNVIEILRGDFSSLSSISIPGFLDSVTDLIPGMALAKDAVGAFGGFVKGIFSDGQTDVQTFADAAINMISTAMDQATSSATTGAQGVVAGVTSALSALGQEGVGRALEGLKGGVEDSTREAADKATANFATLSVSSSKSWDEISRGIEKNVGKAKVAAGEMGKGVEEGLKEIPAAARRVGAQVAAGLANGIRDGAGLAISAAVALANRVEEATEGALDINSPSRVFETLGGYTAAGFADGLKGGVGNILTTLNALLKSVADIPTKKLKGSIAKKIDNLLKEIKKDQVGSASELSTILSLSANIKDKDAKKAVQRAVKAAQEELEKLQAVQVNATKSFKQNLLAPYVKGYAQPFEQMLDLIGNVGNKKLRQHLTQMVTTAAKEFDKLAASYDEVTARLTAAQDLISSGRQKILDYGNVATISTGSSFESIISKMEKARDKAVEYADVLKKLSDAGLNDDALKDFFDAGPDAIQKALSVLNESGGVGKINEIYADLAKAGEKMGTDLATDFYGIGIDLSRGIVEGLKARQNELVAAMGSLADALVTAIETKLKIKSPSRVGMRIGGYFSEGIGIGIADEWSSVISAFDSGSMLTAGADAMGSLIDGVQSRYSELHKALGRVEGEFDSLNTATQGIDSATLAQARKSIDTSINTEGPVVKQFIYNAAENNSLDSEEDLFEAVGRSRFGGF